MSPSLLDGTHIGDSIRSGRCCLETDCPHFERIPMPRNRKRKSGPVARVIPLKPKQIPAWAREVRTPNNEDVRDVLESFRRENLNAISMNPSWNVTVRPRTC